MKMVLLFIALVIALLGTIVLRISGFSPGATGVIAHRTIPDGTRFLVTQTYDVDDLGYKVDFISKPPVPVGDGATWRTTTPRGGTDGSTTMRRPTPRPSGTGPP